MAKHNKTHSMVWIPHKYYGKQKPGFKPKPVLTLPRTELANKLDPKQHEENQKRSLRRTKSEMADILNSNYHDLWVTITVAPNKNARYDYDASLRILQNWLRAERKKNGRFFYFIVPEEHADGAIHFHAVFGGYRGKLVKARNPKTNKLVIRNGRQSYNLGSYKSGHTLVIKTDGSPKIASYMRKYMTKQVLERPGRQRYLVSKDHLTSKQEDNPTWWLGQQPERVVQLQYGTQLYFKPRQHTVINSTAQTNTLDKSQKATQFT